MTAIAIRALRRDEGTVLDDLVAGLSPQSRYLRFHSPVPALSVGMRRALLDVDGRDHIALVAEADDGKISGVPRAVGIVRLIRDVRVPDEAEIAITVVDAWHRRGVGRRLLGALAEQAGTVGVTRLRAQVLAGNEAALGLARAVLPVCLTRRDGDVVHLVGLLDGACGLGITMDDILADLAG